MHATAKNENGPDAANARAPTHNHRSFYGCGAVGAGDNPGAAMPAEQAELHLEGEAYARAFLERLKANTAGPDELAMLTAFMGDGPMLEGFMRVIRKALPQGSEPDVARPSLEPIIDRARRAGFSMRRIVRDGAPRLFVERWGMSRDLPDAAAAARFLDQVEAPA